MINKNLVTILGLIITSALMYFVGIFSSDSGGGAINTSEMMILVGITLNVISLFFAISSLFAVFLKASKLENISGAISRLIFYVSIISFLSFGSLFVPLYFLVAAVTIFVILKLKRGINFYDFTFSKFWPKIFIAFFCLWFVYEILIDVFYS